MFDDLDQTLAALLGDSQAPSELRAAEVGFETPDRGYAPSQATVNLFLHRVREDVALRDPAPVTQRSGDVFVRREPPLRVRCSYLVTTWADPGQGAALKIKNEHRLLGQALAWLRRFPTIPEAYLRGGLAGQPVPPPAVVARPDTDDSSGEFWTALGVPPRPALDLSVTISVEFAPAVVEGPPVVTSELRLLPDPPVFAVTGTVRDGATGGPVPGARVAVNPGGRTADTDTHGRYRLSGLARGAYTLHATAAGHAVDTPIVVPATAPNGYDVTLPA